jgi:hypothetical protein
MKQRHLLIFLLCLYAHTSAFGSNFWTAAPQRKPTETSSALYTAYLVYKLDEQGLKTSLQVSAKGIEKFVILPMPDGSFMRFGVQKSHLLPPGLAAKYPNIETYNAVSLEDPTITAKLDFTFYGFHAMIYAGENTALIDPEDNERTGYYTVHYKRNEVPREGRHLCATSEKDIDDAARQFKGTASGGRTLTGRVLRRYRLALSCSHQYAQAVTASVAPTKEAVLSKMTVTMNRVNGIYEQEAAVTMQFVENEDTLIFTVAAGDPFGPINSSAGALLEKNQAVCDTLIRDANYDIGHVFSTGGGGLSQVGVVCRSGLKAQCVTGSDSPFGDVFDIDYVAHEIGHEYGADHSFNNNQSSICSGNAVRTNAYEPGSGSTIMAYAGICRPDNVQKHSDAYFHSASVQQINNYVTTIGDGCATKILTNYKAPGVPSFSASYTIPARTPFELLAPKAVDSSGDSTTMTYCWEQWDLGGFGQKQVDVTVGGPLFRSYTPVKVPIRVFPKMDMVLAEILSNAGVDEASGEKIPEVTRSMNFRLSLRSNHLQCGSFHLPPDSISVYSINTGTSGFTVTSQNTTGIEYTGFSQQNVTWNVAGSDKSPINASKVDVYMSYDGGYSWPTYLGTFPNTGSALVSMPNPDTTCNFVRIKVKGNNSVFFNVNRRNFRITHNYEAGIRIYPVPAHDYLHVGAENMGELKAAVFNAIGQRVWEGIINGEADLPVYSWARGFYVLKLVDASNRRMIRKFNVN